jgi:hypothetical protein
VKPTMAMEARNKIGGKSAFFLMAVGVRLCEEV